MVAPLAVVPLVFALVFALGGLAFAGLGLYMIRRGVGDLRRGVSLWWSERTSVLEAANAGGTRVSLQGVARPASDTLRAPFTDTESLVAEIEVEELEATGNGGRQWHTIATERAGVPFRLADDTGQILVDPDGAELLLTTGDTITVDAGETAGEPIAAALEHLDVEPAAGGEATLGPISVERGDARRYSERRLDPGETVSVHGPIEHDPRAAAGGGDVNAAIRASAGEGGLQVADVERAESVRVRLLRGTAWTLFGIPFLVGSLGWALFVAEFIQAA